MKRANLHPNPLSGWSEDYPDPEDDDQDESSLESGRLWSVDQPSSGVS